MRHSFMRSILAAALLVSVAGLSAGEAAAASCVQEKQVKNTIYLSSCTVSEFLDSFVPSYFPTLKKKINIQATWFDPSIKGTGKLEATIRKVSDVSAMITGRSISVPLTRPVKVTVEKFQSTYSVPAPEIGLGLPALGLVGYLAWRKRRQPAVALSA